MRLLPRILIALVVSSQLFSQVHIREKVVVGDKARSVTSLQDVGGCDGVYLRQGGVVVIDPQWDAAHVSRYDWEMWLGGSPVLVGNRDTLPTFIGSFKQWSHLVLTMHYTLPPESAYVPYCLDPLSTLSVGPEYPAFLFYRVLETTPLYRWDITMKMEVVADSTLEAMPPQQVFDEFLLPWNPYVRNPDAVMELPYPGTYRVVITRSNANGRDDLVLRSPVDTTLLTEAQAHVQDTLIIGPYPAWTELEMALVSRSSKVLEGQTLYPLATQISPSTWELSFEDWTDLDFDDLDVRVELNVGTPQSLALRTATGVIWYGDTVNVALLPIDSLGRLSPLGRDWTFEYSIEMPDSIRRYGTLILDGDPGYEFEHIAPDAGIGRGLQFAANGDEPDSAVALSFHLKATYVGEIIAAKVSPGEGSGPPGSSGFVQQRAKRQAVQTASLRPQQALEDEPPEIGDVVLENDTKLGLDRDVILLGETKYYAAVKELDPTDPEMNKKVLRLYTVTNFDETGKPLFEGQEREVQFATALTSGAATPTLYYERKWPEWEAGNVEMIDLDEGLIRIVGRYWKEGSEQDKVNLWARSTGPPELFGKRLIEVKKPAKLGNSYQTVRDVTGKDINLDDFIVNYAGENGIPPQLIKGQIERETLFKPAWRYEPFMDLRLQKTKYEDYFASDLPFNVRKGISNDLPESHLNVSPTPYVKNPTTIGDFAVQYWYDRYVKRGKGDQADTILGSGKLTKLWFTVYWSTWMCTELSGVPAGTPELKRYVHDFAQARILDGSYDEHFQNVAQTRKVTSYGYAQMLYITALDVAWKETEGRYGPIGRRYVDKTDDTQYPEKLNEQDFLFPRYSDFTLFDLRVALTEAANNKRIPQKEKYSTPLVSTIHDGNWLTGFEKIWARAMQWYNPGEGGYGEAVLRNARKYPPAYEK